eukprot:TRINITY_DN14633_c0_g5_i1.p3 TRINITY_DN14633_c0_g5~~TRINITY_DN14633_c0_g5_i1.p3  ORF type:complete len:106 (+),score=18.08 TRINITY_DN14633_c0_g5_i1:168-485(+)
MSHIFSKRSPHAKNPSVPFNTLQTSSHPNPRPRNHKSVHTQPISTTDENISVNRPRVCRPAMDRENKRFNVIKQVVQLQDRPIEWLSVVALNTKGGQEKSLESEA